VGEETIIDECREAYESNLELVLKNIPKLEGKTVISSDHGNLFGEHGQYGHPPNKNYKELIEVPYFEVK